MGTTSTGKILCQWTIAEGIRSFTYSSMMELIRAWASTVGEISDIFLPPVRGIADCSIFTLRGESLKRLLPEVNLVLLQKFSDHTRC